jgi:hypothetical protein
MVLMKGRVSTYVSKKTTEVFFIGSWWIVGDEKSCSNCKGDFDLIRSKWLCDFRLSEPGIFNGFEFDGSSLRALLRLQFDTVDSTALYQLAASHMA